MRRESVPTFYAADQGLPANFAGSPCQHNGELWFSDDPVDRTAAKHLCQTCPFMTPCLDATLLFEGGRGKTYRYGIAGGMTPRQRSMIPRRVRPREHGTEHGYKQHMSNRDPLCEPCRQAGQVPRTAYPLQGHVAPFGTRRAS